MQKIGLTILFFILICLLTNQANAHSRNDAGEWYLEFVITWDGKQWQTELSSEDPYYNEEDEVLSIRRYKRREPKLILKSSSNKTTEVSWSLVRGVQLIIKNEAKDCPKTPYQISHFKELDDCPIDSVTSLRIYYNDYGCQLNADIDSMMWLNAHDKSKALKELIMEGKHAPDLAIQSLKEHPVIELQLTTSLGEELTDFKQLQLLTMPGIRSSFAHHASFLPLLVRVSESDGIYRNRFYTEHAERYFWLKYLPSVNMPIGKSIDIEGRGYFYHPLNWLVHLTQLHFPERIENGGEVFVVEDELPEEARYEHDGDTLLHGYLDGDTLSGVWTLRVSEQYAFKDDEAFHIDLNAGLVPFPENGIWELKYASGGTAIQGEFADGLKQGEWLFYTESGVLACKRYFNADTLRLTVVNFHMRGNPLQSRAYYLSQNQVIQAFDNNGKVSFMYTDLWTDQMDPIVIHEKSISILQEGGNYVIYNRHHSEFETIMRKYVIDKVYPEYIGEELPFTY